MIVLSHRGFWRKAPEKNTLAALERTLAEGFGTETDVRDRDGRLVLAHDPAGADAMDWSTLVTMFTGTGLPLAVNVKADGLALLLQTAFADAGIDWFAFDMSGPETVRYAREGLPFFTRHSDVEPEPILYDRADGVWLDAFEEEWFGTDVVRRHLDAGKKVCVVSAELHGRPHEAQWAMLEPLGGAPGLMLCTDLPDIARERFAS